MSDENARSGLATNGNGGFFDRFVHSLMPQPDDLQEIQQQ